MSLGWYSLVRDVGIGVQKCTVLSKSVYRSSVFHLCLIVFHFVHFSFHISFSLILLCISVLSSSALKHSFNVAGSFLS